MSASPIPQDLLTVAEAAAVLRRSPATIRWYLHTRRVRSYRIGRRRLIARADLATLVETIPAATESR
jgi:excisionase family DNA binding protein